MAQNARRTQDTVGNPTFRRKFGSDLFLLEDAAPLVYCAEVVVRCYDEGLTNVTLCVEASHHVQGHRHCKVVQRQEGLYVPVSPACTRLLTTFPDEIASCDSPCCVSDTCWQTVSSPRPTVARISLFTRLPSMPRYARAHVRAGTKTTTRAFRAHACVHEFHSLSSTPATFTLPYQLTPLHLSTPPLDCATCGICLTLYPPLSSLPQGFRSLKEEEEVEFEISDNGGKSKAINVTGPGGAYVQGAPRRARGTPPPAPSIRSDLIHPPPAPSPLSPLLIPLSPSPVSDLIHISGL